MGMNMIIDYIIIIMIIGWVKKIVQWLTDLQVVLLQYIFRSTMFFFKFVLYNNYISKNVLYFICILFLNKNTFYELFFLNIQFNIESEK